MKRIRLIFIVPLYVLSFFPIAGAAEDIAQRILENTLYDEVQRKAVALVGTGFNAGDGYQEVWIRDLATFIETASKAVDHETIENALSLFLVFQGDDGNIVDGYVPVELSGEEHDSLRVLDPENYRTHKNTVETDQESSFIHAVHRYVKMTGNVRFLQTEINGRTVIERMELALNYLFTHKFADQYGLIWGATTIDWGDVQPEHEWGVYINEDTHFAIDIYDNAMLVMAIDAFIDLVDDDGKRQQWQSARERLKQNIRMHLWDQKEWKFRPHIYLDGSPFPAEFNESEMYFLGGTITAIQAGLLSDEEVKHAVETMKFLVKQSGAETVGLTVYPPYPNGYFLNPQTTRPFTYQNAGDWTWFGARIVPPLVEREMIGDAVELLEPMLQRVVDNDGFYEWYDVYNQPNGSGSFRGSAGVLDMAVDALRGWATAREQG